MREVPRPGLAPRANEPETPKGLDLRQLPRGVRAELRGLTSEHAEAVGAHLLMAGQLIDTDPELAFAHAEAARRRAARLPITREAAAETAYAAGDYSTALSEFRALRRMRGGNEYLPAMADCERALGRYQAALKLLREGLSANPEMAELIELRLVEAGIRVETGNADEALRLLRAEIEQVGARGPKLSRARLRYAYADLLEQMGEGDQAERWFDAVVRLDPDQSTDAADRADALRGLVIDFDDDEDPDDDDAEIEPEAAGPDQEAEGGEVDAEGADHEHGAEPEAAGPDQEAEGVELEAEGADHEHGAEPEAEGADHEESVGPDQQAEDGHKAEGAEHEHAHDADPVSGEGDSAVTPE